ncbi:uncharacterized protein LOC142355521 [Convolutriloba macropyga]|uniref:uncharacterized protein LOC142355521 n=1 Tax=Convolutriloba macropyga TaxID=536237 RepID=UPI003F51B3C7
MALLHVDLMSQPSRACALLCRAAGLPVTERLIRIDKKQHKSQEYLAINPFGKVPCLESNGFCLPESGAILRYLCSTYGAANHWYPQDLKQRAKVDAAMDWSYSQLRMGAARLGWHRVIAKRRGLPSSEAGAKEALANLNLALGHMTDIWLKSSPFMAGPTISIADLLVLCELDQLRILEAAATGPYMKELLEPHPVVRAYLARVAKELSPHYESVTKALYASAEAGRASRSKL